MTTDHLADIHGQLETGVEQLTGSESWKSWLRVLQNLPTYSFNNQLLIMMQRPDASRVAGFNKWKQLGRQVRKGSKAIWVLGPVTYKRDAAEGEKPEDVPTSERVLKGFKAVPVFAIEDTDGSELPKPKQLTGDAPAVLWDELSAHLAQRGYTVGRADLPAGLDGYTDPKTHKVVINAQTPPLHQLLTLIHESGHVELDHVKDLAEYRAHRGIMEVEAESVGYVVAGAAGIDASTSSFAYVAGWSGGDVNRIKHTAGRVITASRAILADCQSLRPEPIAVEQSAEMTADLSMGAA